MRFYTFISLLVLATALAAQNSSPDVIQKLLPPDAKIIETADLSSVAGKPRVLVLWMLNPKAIVRPVNQPYFCTDSVNGDYWLGPARLSLVDGAGPKLINTVEVQGSDEEEKNFQLPFLVADYPYHVPHPNAKKEGVPKILLLRDLTGEGMSGQFALFEYVHCGAGTLSSVSGYSAKFDKAVQYQVETIEGTHRPVLSTWVSEIFATKPIRPGHWNFTWEEGHGDFFWNHVEVSFDRSRQVFVERLRRTPYPGFGEASCDLKAEELPRLLKSVTQLLNDGFADAEAAEVIEYADHLQRNKTIADFKSITYRGQHASLLIVVNKYGDGELAISFVTGADLAFAIRSRMKGMGLKP